MKATRVAFKENPLKAACHRLSMRNEILRQLVHLSGLAFIPIAWAAGQIAASAIFLLIALWFLIYSEHVLSRERSSKNHITKLESRLRDFALVFERKETKRPFAGAFFLYLGLGLAFLIFPLNIAIAAGAVLAISDSLSTIIGMRLGRHKLLGKKTWEGSYAFFISAFLVCLLFFSPAAALLAAIAATLAELLPEYKALSRSRLRPLLNDNLLVPLMAGISLSALMMIS